MRALVPLPRVGELPLSINQAWRLTHDRWNSVTKRPIATTHVPLALDFDGPFDVRALEQALDVFVNRHEVLRTAFTMADGSAVCEALARARPSFRQTIRQRVSLPLNHRAVEEEEAEPETSRLFEEQINWLFDYGNPPLMRAALLRFGECHHRLLVTAHHLVSDVISIVVLRRELLSLYESFSRRQSPTLPVVEYHYLDFAQWQQRRIRESEELVTFWRTQWKEWTPALVDARTLPFPGKRADPLEDIRCERLALGPDRSAQIKRTARRHHVTVYGLCLTALFVLLSRYTRRPRVAIWLQFANRSRPEFLHVVGWCANSHIVGADIRAALRVHDLCRHVGDNLLRAQTHEELPISVLWERYGPELAASGGTSQSVGFPCVSFDKRGESVSQLDRLRVTTLERQVGTNDNLNLVVCDHGPTLSLGARCPAKRAGADDLRRMLGHLGQLLDAMSDSSDRLVTDLRLEDA
jgi:condensation domain-containing protein